MPTGTMIPEDRTSLWFRQQFVETFTSSHGVHGLRHNFLYSTAVSEAGSFSWAIYARDTSRDAHST